MPGQVQDTAMRTGTSEAVQGCSHIFADTAAQVIRIPIEDILDHDIGIVAIITGVAHNTQILYTEVTAINLTVTLHIGCIADHLHTETHHTTPEIEACGMHVHHKNLHDNTHIGHSHTPADHETNHITRKIPE